MIAGQAVTDLTSCAGRANPTLWNKVGNGCATVDGKQAGSSNWRAAVAHR
jgi:hypothetical protein